MMISLAANIINLVLNLLFVWILHLGCSRLCFRHASGQDLFYGGSSDPSEKERPGNRTPKLFFHTPGLERDLQDPEYRDPLRD